MSEEVGYPISFLFLVGCLFASCCCIAFQLFATIIAVANRQDGISRACALGWRRALSSRRVQIETLFTETGLRWIERIRCAERATLVSFAGWFFGAFAIGLWDAAARQSLDPSPRAHMPFALTINQIARASVTMTALGCFLLVFVAYFKAMRNGQPEVSWFRVWNWVNEITLRRNVYLEDLFTDDGRYWLKTSFCGVLGFVASIVVGMLLGIVS